MGTPSTNPSPVQIFEGKSATDFDALLNESSLKEEALYDLRAIAQRSGDPLIIETGYETRAAAYLFCADTPSGRYADLIEGEAIYENDIEAYYTNHQRSYWDGKIEDVANEYQVKAVEHQFSNLFFSLPSQYFDSFRGLSVFDQFDDIVATNISRIDQNRSLRILYPGGGHHIAPLLVAMKLIDQNLIDNAKYIYTEIDESVIAESVDILQQAVELEIIDSINIAEPVKYLKGSEQTIEILYKGKSIKLTYAIKRSGQSFYRKNHFKQADLVILHDTGGLRQNYQIMAQMLFQKKNGFKKKEQLMIIEGMRKDPTHQKMPKFPLTPTELMGPYGHCGEDLRVGEVASCSFQSAYTFRLDHKEMINEAKKHHNFWELSTALYPTE